MKFNVSSVINSNNINLSFLEDIKYTSSDVVKVSKLTNTLTDNTIPIFTDFTKTVIDETGQVNIENNTKDLLMTIDVALDKDTLDLLPLWYKHSTRKRYYNITKDDRDVFVRIEGNIIDNLVPANSDLTIVKNSVSIYYRFQGTYLLLDPKYYRVDSINNRIICTDTEFIAAAQDEEGNEIGLYQVIYSVISPDINIIDSNDTIMPSTKYGLDIIEVEGFDNLYEINILTWFTNTTETSYFVEYRTVNKAEIPEETREILRVYPIFQPAESTAAIVDRNDTRYYIDENYDINTKLTEYDTVYIRYDLTNNEYIELRAPQRLPKNIAWYIDIRAGRFTDSATALTYDVLERNKYLLKNETRISKSRVQPITLTNTSLKLFHENIYVNIDNENKFTNIKMSIADKDMTHIINDIDVVNGVLYLSEEVASTKTIIVEYYYRTKYVPYEFINVNPVRKYKDNDDIITKYIVMYMLPREYLNQNLNRSVFHKIVYKHPGAIKDVKNEELNISKCISYIRGVDEQGKSNIYSEVEEFIADGAPDDLKPVVLGSVSINQIIHPDSYDVMDIRQPGMAVAEIYTLSELMDANKDVLSYTDIGIYDNEPLKGNSVVIVNVPRKIVDRLHNLFYNYHTETIQAERTTPGITYSIVRNFIYNTLKKYFKVGTYIKVIYEGQDNATVADYSGFTDRAEGPR